MRVLIFEPGVMGHRLHHVRQMIDAFAELPVEIVAAVAESAPASPEFAAHLSDVDAGVRWDAALRGSQGGFANRASHAVRQLRETIERHRPDRVYVPSGDGLSQMLGAVRMVGLKALPKDVACEAMLLRGTICYPHESKKTALKARLSWMTAKRAPWETLHLLDPLVWDYVRANEPKLAARCDLMPDPVEVPTRDDKRAARRELGIAEDGRYLAVVGLINNRKGCDKLIEAFAAARLESDDRLLLAGVIDSETKPILAREPAASLVRSGRIVCIDRTLSQPELLVAIEAAELIVAFYPRHVGSASLAIRAAAQKRLVLASNYGWAGVIVPKFHLGTTIDSEDTATMPRAIETALREGATFQQSAAGERFVAFHRAENFRAHWTDGARRALGLPRSADWRGWES